MGILQLNNLAGIMIVTQDQQGKGSRGVAKHRRGMLSKLKAGNFLEQEERHKVRWWELPYKLLHQPTMTGTFLSHVPPKSSTHTYPRALTTALAHCRASWEEIHNWEIVQITLTFGHVSGENVLVASWHRRTRSRRQHPFHGPKVLRL